MRYLLIILFVISEASVLAQKCDRPEKVFLMLNTQDSIIVHSFYKTIEAQFYLQDSSEVFLRTSELKEIHAKEYSSIEFYTIEQLRQEEYEIRRCEVSKVSNNIYLDLDINSVFKNIYMVICIEEQLYQFKVHWVDGIE